MCRSVFKLIFLLGLTVYLVIPTCVQAFPTNSVVLANSLTFATYTVTIVSVSGPNSYSPDTITINSGDTVYWNNTDIAPHSATCGTGAPCGQWDSGITSGSGVSSPVTNFSVGTTAYYCAVHGTLMYGAVITLPKATSVTNWEYFTNKEQVDKQPAAPVKEDHFKLVFISPITKEKSN